MIHIPPAMMSADNRYISAVGSIRVLERRLMDRQAMLRLLETKSDDELERILSDYGYGDAIVESEGIHDFETIFTAELKRTYHDLMTLSTEKRLIRLFVRRYDFHNMKTLLRAEALDEKPESALTLLGEIPIAVLKEGLDGIYKKIPNELSSAIRGVRVYQESNDEPQGIDLLMDRSYALFAATEAEALDIPFLTILMRIKTDMNNIKTLMRVRISASSKRLLSSATLPGGYIDHKVWIRLYDRSPEEILNTIRRSHYHSIAETGGGEWFLKWNVSEIERLFTNFIKDYLKQASLTASGAEPVISYLINKENEINTLRTILVGKLNSLPIESIKSQPNISWVFSVH